MRISSANAFETSVDTLQRRQQDLVQAQERLTSGKRVGRASDDPAAAARAERAMATSARAVADQRGLEASRSAMQQAESALGSAVELMQQVRELLVGAGNGSYTDAERANQGARLRGLRDQLLSIANRIDSGSGYHLFGGQGAAPPPFLDGTAGVIYRGSAGRTEVPAGELLPMTMDASSSGLGARTGNGVFVTSAAAANGIGGAIDNGRVDNPTLLTGADYGIDFTVAAGVTTYSVSMNGAPTAAVNVPYVPGQDIAFDGIVVSVSGAPVDGDRFDVTPSVPLFDALERIADELQTPNRSSAEVAHSVLYGLRDIDGLSDKLSEQRAMAGESLNRIDAVGSRLAATDLAAQTERSAAEDLDMVQALSDFQNKQTGYEAALKTYSMVQRMSLFQYLSG